jgi:hypothetical protein
MGSQMGGSGQMVAGTRLVIGPVGGARPAARQLAAHDRVPWWARCQVGITGM